MRSSERVRTVTRFYDVARRWRVIENPSRSVFGDLAVLYVKNSIVSRGETNAYADEEKIIERNVPNAKK